MNTEEKRYKVTIADSLSQVTVQAIHGERLLDVLQRSGKPVHAPCGGKGTCQKCKVHIRGVGEKNACQHTVHNDLEIVTTSTNGFNILHQQNRRLRTVTTNTGITVLSSADRWAVSYRDELLFKTQLDQEDFKKMFGLAIDVGSTTVVVFLEDLSTGEEIDVAAFVNPQTAFGADVISRITYCIENTDGLDTLQGVLLGKINEAVYSLCTKNGVNHDQIFKTVFVGNTVMLHILAGVIPRSIAFAPFTPVFLEARQLKAREVGLPVHPDGVVSLLPSIAGYVGADVAAGLATTDMLEREAYSLYIDIGTNGEIALGNREYLFCCATAAGPAFEGANITCGTGSIPGAISEYTEDGLVTIGNQKPAGICGSGLIDIVASLLDEGLISSMGYMEASLLLTPGQDAAVNHDIVLTPKDVRKVQLAKAAIFAGIQTLVKAAGIGLEEIEILYLAGGFGNYIRPESAGRIGMLPVQLVSRTVAIGNAAGTGARYGLHSIEFEDNLRDVAKRAEYIELSNHGEFNEAYVGAMGFES